MSPIQRRCGKVQMGVKLSRTGEWTWWTNSPMAKSHSPRVTGECNSRALYYHLLPGGLYGGASIIKSRLLPFLGQNFFTSGGSVTADTSLSVLAEAAAKNREVDDLQDMYETSLNELEQDLKTKEMENQDLRDE